MQIIPQPFQPQQLAQNNQENQLALVANYIENPDIPIEDRMHVVGRAVTFAGRVIDGLFYDNRALHERVNQLQAENEGLLRRVDRMEDVAKVEVLRQQFFQQQEDYFKEISFAGGWGGMLLGAFTAGGLGFTTLPAVSFAALTGIISGATATRKLEESSRKSILKYHEEDYKRSNPDASEREAFEYAKVEFEKEMVRRANEEDFDQGYQATNY